MNTWYLISVYVHIICAAFWIGGMLFLPLVVLPGIKGNNERVEILYKTGIRFRLYGWIALAILVASGIVNMNMRGIPFTADYFLHTSYGKLITLKVAVFCLVLLVSALHDFRLGNKAIASSRAGNNNDSFRKIARWSGRINLTLTLAIAFMGVMLSRGIGW